MKNVNSIYICQKIIPNIYPEAILNNNPYPMFPAAPVTATLTGGFY